MNSVFLFFSEGLSSTQKKRKARGKLLSAQKSLKKRLELSYGVEILDKKNNSAEPETQSEKHLNTLMNELKQSFLESKCHSRKLQILTLSPYTIDKTASFFQTTIYKVKKKAVY